MFDARTSASAVARGSWARPGNTAKTAGLLMTELVVKGMMSSSWFIQISATFPLMLVVRVSLAMPSALTTCIELSGASAMRPRAAPFPLT